MKRRPGANELQQTRSDFSGRPLQFKSRNRDGKELKSAPKEENEREILMRMRDTLTQSEHANGTAAPLAAFAQVAVFDFVQFDRQL